MSDWRIDLAPTAEGQPLFVDVLNAQAIWKCLSKPAQAAVEAAYPDGRVVGHAGTVSSLLRHGFVEWEDADPSSNTGWHLTDAGRAVAKWCVTP